FVNPEVPIPFRIEELTGINDNMVLDAPTIEQIPPEFLAFSEGAVMVAHNASFDMSFLEENARRLKMERTFTSVDTMELARFLLPRLHNAKLDTVAKAFNISLENHHRAVDDAGCTAEIFEKLIAMLEELGAHPLDEVNDLCKPSVEEIKKLRSHH